MVCCSGVPIIGRIDLLKNRGLLLYVKHSVRAAAGTGIGDCTDSRQWTHHYLQRMGN
jgi:hypothetical protein